VNVQFDPETLEQRGRARSFMEVIYPNESVLDGEDDEGEALVQELRGTR
jgi:hypothetical protein